MKEWEDIIKDRLEGYESTLPEGSLEQFRTRRMASGGTSSRKRARPAAWLLVAAAAACLAIVFIPRNQDVAEEGVQIVPAPVAEVPETDVQDTPGDTTDAMDTIVPRLIAQNISSDRFFAEHVNPVIPVESAKPAEIEETVETETNNITTDTTALETSTPFQYQEPANDKSPSLPLDDNGIKQDKKSGANIGTVIAGVLGTGMAGALIPGFSGLLAVKSADVTTLPINYFDVIGASQSYLNGGYGYPELKDMLVGANHNLPLRVGLSARIPVSNRLGITTGATYSLYSSEFDYSESGHKKQYARYAGIPVRLDWTIATTKRRRIEVYAGAGFEGDFCLAATFGGQDIKKDGFGLSLLGAGGVQWNIAGKLGLYLEPELSWGLTSKNRVLETYRSEHPLMFSATTGLRLTLGK